MMGYIVGAIVFTAICLYLWLTGTARRTVLRSVGDDDVLKEARLSEKPRWKVIKEDHGWAIGFIIGLSLGICVCLSLLTT